MVKPRVNRKAYHSDYYLKHRDKIIQRTRKYQKKHKKLCGEYQVVYRKKNKELHKKYSEIWRFSLHGIYSVLRNKAKKRNIDFNILEEDFKDWYNKQKQKCIYCGRSLTTIQKDTKESDNHKHRLTIDRKDNKKGYTIENITLACYRCNVIKGNYFTEKEMLKIGRIIYKNG
jgi:5-methylcytosine-specific restriction endonuclease McrA